MELLEYQAKELFKSVGIPVLPSQKIRSSRELKELELNYPLVLKSQVRSGGRSKAGGIKFVQNSIDAFAAAQSIFNLSILGEYPQVILAECQYNREQEFYLAVMLKTQIGRPVLLGSRQGGIDVKKVIASLHEVIIDQTFSPFYARRLAIKMGLSGKLLLSVSSILEKMYQLFIDHDLDGVEINPLGVDKNQDIMALDGKVLVNEYALPRHPNLAIEVAKVAEYNYSNLSLLCSNLCSNFCGDIGVIANGTSLTISTLESLYHSGITIGSCFAIGTDPYSNWVDTLTLPQLTAILPKILKLKIVLINLIIDDYYLDTLINCLLEFFKNQGIELKTKFIIRIVSSKLNEYQKLLEATPITWVSDIDQAISTIINLSNDHQEHETNTEK